MNKVHFVGIGGIGMSGLADILLSKGKTVSGSDLKLNYLTERLENNGALISKGHVAENVPAGTDLVIRSSCIKTANPEIIEAGRKGISIISRGELLKRFIDQSPVSISITGTHGKTTTSALTAHIMEYCGVSPTSIIGGEVAYLGGNAKYGDGDILIAEVDESDGFFRNIGSTYSLITNIEREHIENYGSMKNLLDAYEEFIGNIKSDGVLFYNGEDLQLLKLIKTHNAGKISFGINGKFDYTCGKLSYKKYIEFNLICKGSDYGRIWSPLVGRHNVMNLLASVAVCLESGIHFGNLKRAIECFNGVDRRFQSIGTVGTIEVIEDYAHHPTELTAVIKAAKDYGSGRVIAVFQPHRHSRTKDLAEDFIKCFNDADVLLMTDIYSAHENLLEGVDAGCIFDRINKNNFEIIDYIPKIEICAYVSKIVRPFDIVLVLGAGDISEISGSIVDIIREKRNRKILTNGEL